jgi:hypothetical protein
MDVGPEIQLVQAARAENLKVVEFLLKNRLDCKVNIPHAISACINNKAKDCMMLLVEHASDEQIKSAQEAICEGVNACSEFAGGTIAKTVAVHKEMTALRKLRTTLNEIVSHKKLRSGPCLEI